MPYVGPMSSAGGAGLAGGGRVGAIFGGPSPRHDLSILTGLEVARAFLEAGRPADEVVAIYWGKNGRFFAVGPGCGPDAFAAGVPEDAREARLVAEPGSGFWATHPGLLGGHEERLVFDVLVNCCHGGPGQDGALQGALDLAGITYTGPSSASASLCADRLALSALALRCGLPAVQRALVASGADRPAAWASWEGPYLVKPRSMGSPMSPVMAPQWADVVRLLELGGPHVAQGLVAEPRHEGMARASVGLLTYPAPAFSPVAISGLPHEDGPQGPGPGSPPGGWGPLGDSLQGPLEAALSTLAQAAQLRGACRADFVVSADGQEWWLDEVDTLPPCFGRELWGPPEDVASCFASLLEAVTEEAGRRPTAQWGSPGADESVLLQPPGAGAGAPAPR